MTGIEEGEREFGFLRRLWIYQQERFPLGRTALLLLVFTAASITLSARMGGRDLPGVHVFVAIWLATVLVFFQLRAADEYKDFEDDARYRPERAVPRGLVSLRSILSLAVGAAPIILGLSLSITPMLLIPLALLWGWLGLMTAEFFVPTWLKARPFIYLVSHMAIMAFIDFFVTAAEWLPHSPLPPAGIWIFVILSCINGCILEFGRKIWAPVNEREGVETYSRLLGPRLAVQVWLGLCAVAWVLLSIVGAMAGASFAPAILGAIALIAVGAVGMSFFRVHTPRSQERLDMAAGAWVVACYAIAGLSPYLGRILN